MVLLTILQQQNYLNGYIVKLYTYKMINISRSNGILEGKISKYLRDKIESKLYDMSIKLLMYLDTTNLAILFFLVQ